MNAHNEWTRENVAEWVFNDLSLFDEARLCAINYDARTAAKLFLDSLTRFGITHTPDGARYSVANLAPIMADIRRA